VLFTVHTIAILVTIKISIADLIEGPGAYQVGNPYAVVPLDVKKIVPIFTVKNMLKFGNF